MKRFGRRQKAKLKMQITAAENAIDCANRARDRNAESIESLVQRIQEMESSPFCLTGQQRCRDEETVVFCVQINPKQLEFKGMNANEIHTEIANELTRSILNNTDLHKLIKI